MRHPRHLCFTLSVILCIRAAYGHWEDYLLKSSAKKQIEAVLKGTNAQYNGKLENKVADDIASYTLRYKIEKPEDVTKLLVFVNDFEMPFYYKAKYFESEKKLYKHIVHYEGKVGCAHLPHYPRGYICLIEVPMSLNL